MALTQFEICPRTPPCDDVCAPDAAASTAPRPAFSDDRETPLLGGRDGGSCRSDLGETRSGLFLREERFLICVVGQISAGDGFLQPLDLLGISGDHALGLCKTRLGLPCASGATTDKVVLEFLSGHG
jgi:hypothetical protein